MTRHPIVRITAALSILLLVVVFTIGGLIYGEVQQHQFSDCMSKWANDTTSRSQLITTAQQRRGDALDALVRSISAQSEATFGAALAAYLKESDAYNDTVKAHPVVAPPSVRC